MRILITSGGTTEKIDDVRVLTNISSGALGAVIAEAFGPTSTRPVVHDVTYVCTKASKKPGLYTRIGEPNTHLKIIFVSDVASLMTAMEELVPTHDVVIHAMAVSDFGFRRDTAVKLKSNDPQAFIDYMRDNIVVNPKIISYIKKWNPKCKLVGFKFEVGLTNEQLIEIASKSLFQNSCDVVIANDKVEMNKEKEHIAYAITPAIDNRVVVERLVGKQDIAEYLVGYVKLL